MLSLLQRQTPRRDFVRAEESEVELHRMLDAMYDESNGDRQKEETAWDLNTAYALGDQWRSPRASGLYQATDNMIWRVQQQTAALLTDTKPNVEITSRPNSENWEQINRELRKSVEAVWFLNDLDRSLVRNVYDLYNTGNAYLKCYWDPFKQWGTGDIGIARISPRYVWRDPNGDSLENSEYILYRMPISLWEIRRRYDPVKAVQVTPDATLSSFTDSPSRHWFPLPRPRRKKKANQSAIPKAWIEEWWIKDPATDATGKLMYPAGRVITRAGHVKLFDGANPYWDPWPGPWIDFTVNQLEDSAYGEPDTTQMRVLQDAINLMVSLIIDNARFITNGVWIMDEEALAPAERKKLMSKPGAVIAKRPGRELRRDTGQSLPGQVIEVLNMLKGDLQFVSGIQDSGYGQKPKGITAAAAIESLQMATQATIRLKAREIEAGLVRLGQRIVARIFQHYTDQRVMDYLGSNGIVPITWDPSILRATKLDDDQKLEEADRMPNLTDDDRRDLLKQFRVRISPASSLALSKERRWAQEMALFGAGLIDAMAVLTAIDYPDKDAVLQRMAAAAQERTSAGARAAQGPRPRGRGVSITQNMIRG
jgi:type II secretory pathway pseudopilin PulG